MGALVDVLMIDNTNQPATHLSFVDDNTKPKVLVMTIGMSVVALRSSGGRSRRGINRLSAAAGLCFDVVTTPSVAKHCWKR
jgi:hypothetical protein